MKNQQFKIQGMSCQGCANAVKASLNNLAGVEQASIDLSLQEADVTFDEKEVTVEQLKAAVAETGYTLIV